MTKRKIGKSLFIHPNNEMFPITINRLPGAFDLNIGYIPIGYIQSFSAIISDHLNNQINDNYKVNMVNVGRTWLKNLEKR